MALEIRFCPVLEGPAAEAFEKKAHKALKEKGTIKPAITKKQLASILSKSTLNTQL